MGRKRSLQVVEPNNVVGSLPFLSDERPRHMERMDDDRTDSDDSV